LVRQRRALRATCTAALPLGIRSRVRSIVIELREQLVDVRQALRRRESGADVAADGIALEIPGDVLADVAASAILVIEEVDEQLSVTAERICDESKGGIDR